MPSLIKVTIAVAAGCSAWSLYTKLRHFRKLQAPPSEATLQVLKEAWGLTPEEYEKSQSYQRDRAVFSMVNEVYHTTVSSLILAYKVNPFLWASVLRLAARAGVNIAHGASVVDDHACAVGLSCPMPATGPGVPELAPGGLMHGLLYSSIGAVIELLMELPLSYYNTFVLEERHGFNKQTLGSWAKDHAISFALRCCVFQPLLGGSMMLVVRYTGRMFPNYLFGVGTALLFGFTYVYPACIQPLFNTFSDVKDEQLKSDIHALAGELKFPLTKLYEIDGSKRSSHSNAYFYGFFNNKRIVLFDTLISQLGGDRDQVLAVLCHEFGHWKKRHTIFLLTLPILQLFLITHTLRSAIFDTQLVVDFGFDPHTVLTTSTRWNVEFVNPIVALEAYSAAYLTPLMALLPPAVNAVSRQFEFQADRFAVDMGYGEQLVSALKKISAENKGCIDPDWLYCALNYSHPPMLQRLAAIEKYLAETKPAKRKGVRKIVVENSPSLSPSVSPTRAPPFANGRLMEDF